MKSFLVCMHLQAAGIDHLFCPPVNYIDIFVNEFYTGFASKKKSA